MMCVEGVPLPQHTCGGQRMTLWAQFLSSTLGGSKDPTQVPRLAQQGP